MVRKSIYPPSVKPGIPRLGQKPEGWVETTFGQVLENVERPARLLDDVLYQLVIAKRSRGGIVARDKLYGKDISTKTQFYIAADDFLISKRQIIHGACGIVPGDLDGAVVSNEYCTLRPKPCLDLTFLGYCCHTDYFQQTCFHASVGVDVEKMIFRLADWFKYPVYIPPLPEQRKIGVILSTWDEAITLTERLIEALRQRKQAIMQLLLTGEMRFKGFEGEAWHEVEFSKIAARNGSQVNPLEFSKDLPCVELEHISQGTGQIIGHTSLKAQKSIKNRFSAGQVLFGKLRPYLRKFAQPDFEGVASSEIWVLNANPVRCSNDFLFYLVQSDAFSSAANVTSGTKMPRADWETIANMLFVLPGYEEQNKIVGFLSSSDQEQHILERIREQLQTEKRGLMQQLLTGAIRVKVDEDHGLQVP